MPLQELTRELVEEIAQQYPALQSLNLAANALRDVAHLALLPNLLRIDLSSNRLHAVPSPQALGACGARLEFLDLSANAIESLLHVDACASLRVLDLRDNRIELFSELRHLQPLQRLEVLTLQGNPIAASATYRREVLSLLPQLRRLDDEDVTPAERLFLRVQRRTELQSPESPVQRLLPPPVVTWPSTGAAVEAAAAVAAERPSPNVVDAAVSPVASAALLTPERLHRQRVPRASADSADQLQSLRVDVAVGAMTPTRLRAATTTAASEAPKTTTSVATMTLAAPVGADVSSSGASEQQHLLESRISALEAILALQDRALERHLVDVGKAATATRRLDAASVQDAARAYTELLAAWRSKVVALMVQLASLELRRSDDAQAFERQARDLCAANAHAQHECALWQQKLADTEAQRDLERVRRDDALAQSLAADAKAVSAVRTLALERSKLEHIASAVAVFSARDGVMVDKMERLYATAARLEAFERRLHYARERIATAATLLAHREARLRNSEAAIDAERRIWHHRLAQQQQQSHLSDSNEVERAALQHRKASKAPRYLRPATEAAFKSLFQQLDPYDTGLVRTQLLLDALAAPDSRVERAVGGAAKRALLVRHMEHAIRQRSVTGTISGTITWGELLLLFMPAEDGDNESSAEALNAPWHASGREQRDVTDAYGTTDDAASSRATASAAVLPPPFDAPSRGGPLATANDAHQPRRLARKALDAMTRDELVHQVLTLQDDREQLRARVLRDARELQRRAKSIRSAWSDKVTQLVDTTSELERALAKQQSATQRLTRDLETAERRESETRHALESLRRELLTQQSDAKRAKELMATEHRDALLQEQQIWQRELQDASFRHAVTQTENQKLELRVRQLERDLAKRNDALVAHETQRIAHLDAKVQQRDGEIAKLRRERNTLLSTLREHERKLASHRPVSTESVVTQTELGMATLSAALDRPAVRSVGSQTAPTAPSKHRPQATDMRMSLDEIAAPTAFTADGAQDEIARRLQQLQSLTASLLDDDDDD